MGDPSKYARMVIGGYRLKAAEISELARGYRALKAENRELRDAVLMAKEHGRLGKELARVCEKALARKGAGP